MRKFILGVVLSAGLVSTPVQADDWVAPLLGGMILGNVFAPRPYFGGYYSPPPQVVYNYNSYNTYVPPPLPPVYTRPAYRVATVWDGYCYCYRNITVPNY